MKYAVISNQKRSELLTRVLKNKQSLRLVADQLKIKLPSAKSIIRTFKKTGRIFNKKKQKRVRDQVLQDFQQKCSGSGFSKPEQYATSNSKIEESSERLLNCDELGNLAAFYPVNLPFQYTPMEIPLINFQPVENTFYNPFFFPFFSYTSNNLQY